MISSDQVVAREYRIIIVLETHLMKTNVKYFKVQ